MKIASLPRLVLDWVSPPACAVCAMPEDGRLVCRYCRSALPWIHRACPRCAAPLPAATGGLAFCGNCIRRPPPMSASVAPLDYAFPIDAMLKALKFENKLWLAPAFAELLVEPLAARAAAADAIVPLPLNRWRHATRGFNQAGVIASALARLTRVPLVHCLRRDRRTRPQSGLDGVARRRNVRGAFSALDRPIPAHVLLVDDVMTTGATMNEAASTLLHAGSRRVTAVAVARA